ncbi:nitroreductase family protein [Cytobacillus horneckiae]|uniref:Nitroreductase family protein n=1 Tax=Cytobacillus horneckiae TaxID=549687 RepID=A0A2N0ZC53_9BACI|nr:nitroreductase family protein [Cytobacillus horneckiae]MCM3177495.1 nitroreductase family protein [Cytobacillus horneckiae]MEC1155942.1 nitroreductase family protein [Cytobacillus horneckiae]MED2939782.1 nitroreductase family protein [Cytobacillus horneckiae]PKG27088.1 nitroreductase family protein [Cytobacillus horneckiae]
MSELEKIMNDRKSVRSYDPDYKIKESELEDLLSLATSAPSSSNLQSWRFIVIQDQEMKKELRSIANNQAQIEDSSAVIAVLGDMTAYKNVEEIYKLNVEAGYMDQSIADRTIENTFKLYPNAPKEALMNIASYDAGLISMQILLLAKERGLDTVVMGGFNKAAFAEKYNLEENIFPITLIAIGKAAAPAFNSTRLPLNRIAKFY